ncbi:MAG: cytosolic protein [Dehalococcoidia bacterium]|nr:cytosolic protein [Dehalococcoidia bacterium]
MADKEMVRGLLQGAFDTHVHSGPDVLPRRFTDIDLAGIAQERGFGGFVLKSHHAPTADRANLIRSMFPGVNVYGAIALNNPVGGLNPVAIDVAGRLGAKVVWLPTMDSANEQANVAGQLDESKLPYWMSIARELREQGIAGRWLTVTDGNGNVLPEMQQCLDVMAKYDMVMATGHIAPPELEPVIKAAKQAGVQRIIVTHPEFPTTHLDIDAQKNLQKYDVYFERCFTTPFTAKCSWEETLGNIREVGPSSTIIATDLGQTINPALTEGFEIFIDKMIEFGLSDQEIKQITQHNAASLLGAE